MPDLATLAADSASTRKASTSREDRVSKRREKFPVHENLTASCEDIGGDAAVVKSTSRGGLFVEYIDDAGYAHAVPMESLVALGFVPPAPKPDPTTAPKPDAKK